MNNNIQVADALSSLRPGSEWTIRDGNVEWLDSKQTQPTETEIDTEVTRLQVEYDATQYQRDRQYPSIGDQLDMIFHAGLGGDEFQAAIQAVKDAYPKPE